MYDLGLDYFLIKFKLHEDYLKVINEGPWFIGQQFLSVRQWTPGFRPSEAQFITTAVWARLPKLPIEVYNTAILRRIGNQLGTLLKIDACTIDNIKGRYARFCIQIDLDSPLTSKVRIGSLLQSVQYEGVSAIYFEYGCMGHRVSSCPSVIRPPPPKNPQPLSPSCP